MVISPNDFSLWARLTGNKYPSTPAERAKKGPEVHNFIQNLDKEGMLGGKDTEEPKKERNLAEKVATGALIAGGVAAAVAAGRDPNVQNFARRAGSTAKDKVGDFLRNIGGPRVVDRDVVDASYDVTPDPRQQQSNVAPAQLKSGPDSIRPSGLGSRIVGPLPDVSPATSVGYELEKLPDFSRPTTPYVPGSDIENEKTEQYIRSLAQLDAFTKSDPFVIGMEERDPVSGIRLSDIDRKISESRQPVAVERFTPAVEGKTFGTSGAVSKLEDIGDAKLRARRTYGPMIDAVQQKNPGINVGGMGRSMLAKAEQDRDYDIAYMVARGQGKTDETATQIARQTAGFPTDSPVGKPTPYREFLGEQRTSSIRKESIDNLLNLVETGPQIILPEKAQKMNDGSSAIVLAGGGNNTNVIPTMGATIGGSSLTDKHATKMAVDNALDNARANYEQQVSAIVEAGQTKGGSISTASRAERFLQRVKPDVVKNLDTAIQEDLQATTGLNPEDASNIAGSIINPITGQREISSVQKAGSKMAMKGATRKPFEERSIPNIDPETNQGTIKTAVGTSIRGRAPSYDQTRFVERTREDINDPKGGDLPDIQGGISGPSAQELLKRKSGELMQYTGKRPAGEVAGRDEETKLLGDRAPRTPVRRVISPAADQGDPGPGVGIYGEGTGFLPGPFSSTAEKAPTDTFGKSSPFKGVSDSTLTKLKSDMKPGTKSFESVDKEQKGRASIDLMRQVNKIQSTGNPDTVRERIDTLFDKIDPTGELRKRNLGK